MKDHEIVALFFERSEQAITELDRLYGARCHQLAGNILNNRQDVEECVNDAYFGAWNAIPPERPEKLAPYICRIVRNLALKKYHANTAQKRNSYYDTALDELEDCFAAPESTDSLLSAKELSGLLNTFLATLSPEDRRLFVRRYWFADPIPSMALRFHTSENNVSVRLNRIRSKLRQYLRKEGYFV